MISTSEVSRAILDMSSEVILPRLHNLATDEVHEKAPGELVTVVDWQAERVLGGILSTRTPGSLIVGEESVHEDTELLARLPQAKHAWVLDPLDGTRNFVNGNPNFAVILSEIWQGRTRRSWIWQPVHQLLYVAERGGGVTRNGRPLLRNPRTATGPYSTRPSLAEAARATPLTGSCGVDYSLLAEGERDFLVFRSQQPWDHLAGCLIITETGGRAATIEGRDFGPGVSGRLLIVARREDAWDGIANVTRRLSASGGHA